MFERRPLLSTSRFARRIDDALLNARPQSSSPRSTHSSAGVTFVTTVAVLFAPLVHRFFHHFHLELAEDEPTPDPGRSDLA